ncbi:ribonuclease HII [Lacticaseibacillus brantae]|uniref:Ribonuclease HII n=1 Tax=Lacticaseibacillus brantae DSM 23927 TaxID=1423727 RepID=A0A0R2AZ99_9LACO|nr:ribonuclease HII [Lacticaseibacillus brantae]KRM72622.1 ribonuclease H [Lacticaseibacillus brantae DSM 23927]
MPTLSDYRQQLAKIPADPAVLAALAQDERVGATRLLAQYEHRVAQQKNALLELKMRSRYERQLWPQYPHIAGIDEVGRGPLAGPVVTAAVILPHDFSAPVNDSKQLSAKTRQQLYTVIMSEAVSVSLGVSDAKRIDQENIYHATELAMGEAVSHLSVRPDYLLVDAMTVPTALPQQKLIKGDANSISIAAASIVAKVVRDELMTMYAQVYPGYDFGHNMGYGTKKHLAGLDEYGVTPIHRHSFEPVQRHLQDSRLN